MANFISQSSLDSFFTVGKVAFGHTDYVELSAYILVIAGVFLAVLACAGDVSVVEKAQSPIKVTFDRVVDEAIQQEAKITKKKAERTPASTPSKASSPTKATLPGSPPAASTISKGTPSKKNDFMPETPRRSERIHTRTPKK